MLQTLSFQCHSSACPSVQLTDISHWNEIKSDYHVNLILALICTVRHLLYMKFKSSLKHFIVENTQWVY
jgi:hypothetical protein